MATPRKKPLTELEKLTISDCVGKRFVSSRRVTPDNQNKEVSDANITRYMQTGGVQCNLAATFND